MSRRVELLCLANSDKEGDRCIAGLDLDTGDWVRPVSDSDGSGLSTQQYLTKDLYDPDPLDTIKFTLSEPDPEPHQPENWIISSNRPEFQKDEIGDREAQILIDNIHSKSHLFGDKSDKIKYSNIKREPVKSSLELIRPESPQFKIRKRDGKPRAAFQLQDTRYDLPVTDPLWKQRIKSDDILSDVELEYEPASAYTPGKTRPLFTISLGSPHNGSCYKLVAAVIAVSPAVIDYIDSN
jgi:hypothetical protein